MTTDAIGRLRISSPNILFTYNTNGPVSQDIFYNTITETGTIIQNPNINSLYMLSVTNKDDMAMRTSKLYMENQHGLSQLCIMEGILNGSKNSKTTIARIGLFSTINNVPDNGFFFEYSDQQLYIVVYSFGKQLYKFEKTEWNIDKFDGNGASHMSIDISKILIFIIDYVSNGRIRFGFNIKGINYYAHQILNNSLSTSCIKTTRLPIKYQIISSLESGIMYQGSCTNIIEGVYSKIGKRNNICNTMTGISLDDKTKKYILLALKINPEYPYASIKLLKSHIIFIPKTTSIYSKYEFQLHSSINSVGTISGTLDYLNLSESVASYAVGNSSQIITSDGYILTNGFLIQNTTEIINFTDDESKLHRMVLTQYDILYIVGSVNSNASNSIMTSSLDFIEYW